MQLSGWLMLAVSWGGVLALTAFCLWRTLAVKPQELSAPLELEAEIDQFEARKEQADKA